MSVIISRFQIAIRLSHLEVIIKANFFCVIFLSIL